MSEFESEFKGRVYLDRRIRETEWYTGCTPNTVFLMFHLLLSAHYDSGVWKGVKYKRGDVITAIGTDNKPRRLMEETRLCHSSLMRALKKLEELGEIKVTTKTGFNGYTHISILNYDLYAGMDKKVDSKPDSKVDKKPDNSKEVKETKKEVEMIDDDGFEDSEGNFHWENVLPNYHPQ